MYSPTSAIPASERGSKIAPRMTSVATPMSGQTTEMSRRPSNQGRTSSRPSSPQVPAPSPSRKTPRYTVFVRLPFPRDSFEDPPPVEWDATKDRKLWKLISGNNAGKADLDWEGLSQYFGVDLSFLLMQAAWLSERHMERMRKQVGKIGVVQAEGGGSAIGSAVGGLKMERTSSRDSKMPPASATTTRRGSPSFPQMSEQPGHPSTTIPLVRATISRTPSSATVTQSKVTGSSAPRQSSQVKHKLRGSNGSGRRPGPAVGSAQGSPRDELYEDAIDHEGGSDSESDEEPSAMTRSQAFRRPPVSRKIKPTLGTVGSEDGDAEDDEDDDDSSGGYLPFAASSKPAKTDPSATLRGPPKKQTVRSADSGAQTRPKTPRGTSNVTTTTESSASSVSSAMHHQFSSDTASGNEQSPQIHGRSDRPPGALSPRHRAQLASLSPRARKEGSEGSPSMGSSFSDLDDASVTQSALEEALLSNMRQGGNSYGSSMASRVSSIRDALGRRNQ